MKTPKLKRVNLKRGEGSRIAGEYLIFMGAINEELSGIELRKALCEALGYKLYNYDQDRYADSDADYEDAFRNDGWTWENSDFDGEAYAYKPESDPGVFWPEFDKWRRRQPQYCRFEVFAGSINGRPDYAHFIIISAPLNAATTRYSGEGETVELAGCRAWLAALRAQTA
jgi:hypothetical protein